MIARKNLASGIASTLKF